MAASAFRGLRRDIALALSGKRKRTLYETAKVLGRRSGDIQRVVRQMHDEGILKSGDPEPTQGTVYWLAEDWVEALMEEIADGVVPGVLVGDQRLLVVKAPDLARFYGLLGHKDFAGIVVWASELGGDGEWMLALDPKAPRVPADRLVIALKAAGFACTTHRVQSVLDAAELRQSAVAAADAVESVKSLGLTAGHS